MYRTVRTAGLSRSLDKWCERPANQIKLDYEVEIAVVIGKNGRRTPEEKAFEYIAGYPIYNDGSVRDWQQHTFQWGSGKNFERTGALGLGW